MEELIQIENFKKYPSSVTSVKISGNKTIFHCASETFELTVLSENIFRLRYAAEGCFEKDFSYAIRPDFKSVYTNINRSDSDNEYIIKRRKLYVKSIKEV